MKVSLLLLFLASTGNLSPSVPTSLLFHPTCFCLRHLRRWHPPAAQSGAQAPPGLSPFPQGPHAVQQQGLLGLPPGHVESPAPPALPAAPRSLCPRAPSSSAVASSSFSWRLTLLSSHNHESALYSLVIIECSLFCFRHLLFKMGDYRICTFQAGKLEHRIAHRFGRGESQMRPRQAVSGALWP